VIVPDASALLALLLRQSDNDRVAESLDDACMGTVNLAEALTRMQRVGDSPAAVLDDVHRTPVEVVPFTRAHALTTAELVPLARAAGLSLGDRACPALERGLDVLTADRARASLSLPVRVEVVR
jgi:ribonuclease VapC